MVIDGSYFLSCVEIICCELFSGPSHRDGSDEGSQHIILCRTNKNYPKISSNTSFLEL